LSPADQKDRFMLKETYRWDELLAIMDFLRSDQGCPWDRVQTHESIQGNMLEEAYEAVDAIQSQDPARLSEELGDVLMQVIFHAGIARDAGDFTLEDVIAGICRKLISRHSHLFGEDEATTPEMVLRTWEKNKRIEKGFDEISQAMRDVPKALPALIRATKIQKKAADTGFDWPSADGAAEKVKEELEELMAEVASGDQDRLQEEAGDLLFAAVNLVRLLGLDAEASLSRCSERFIRRFAAMEDLARDRAVPFEHLSLEAMDGLWGQVKEREKSGGEAKHAT